jgi:hypothetical protein
MIEFKDLELHYESSAAVTATFYTGQQSAALTSVATLTFPATSGREADVKNLDGLVGILYKVKFAGTAAVKLFAGKLRWRRIGCYFDGANGEYFETQPTGVGI